MNDRATHVIELTPPGRAAVAVVLVAGPNAIDAVHRCTSRRSRRGPVELPVNLITLASWGGPTGEEVILCRRGDDQVEVHCHGGAAAVRSVIEGLMLHGCRQMSWQTWLRTSESDPIRAAARIALTDAPTERTANILLDQYHDALFTALREVIDGMAVADTPRAMERLDELIARGRLGMHLTSPWRVVIAGSPNVGKSSLLNALAGFQRAIVSPLPGTTRDVVTLTTAIDGWPVTLADTAGLRSPADELEAAGVELTHAAVSDADFVVIVEDASKSSNTRWEAPDLVAMESEANRSIRVWNKCDLLPANLIDRRQRAERQLPALGMLTSAITGEGIEELLRAIGQALLPSVPPPGAAVPFTMEQVGQLTSARSELRRGNSAAASATLQSLLASESPCL